MEMNQIVIRSGFQSICDDSARFRKDVLRKGELLYKADRIFCVQEIWKSGEIKIEARCVPEMSINSIPYNVTIYLDDNRNIERMHCSCVAGSMGQCKHTSALVLFINGERDETCTDHQMNWNQPSEKNKSLHRKGQSLDKIFGTETPTPKYSKPNPEAIQQYLEIFK
jgi:hypothetical protein